MRFFAVINLYGFKNLASVISAQSWLGLAVSAAFCSSRSRGGARVVQKHLHHRLLWFSLGLGEGENKPPPPLAAVFISWFGAGLALSPLSLLPAHLDPLPHMLQPEMQWHGRSLAVIHHPVSYRTGQAVCSFDSLAAPSTQGLQQELRCESTQLIQKLLTGVNNLKCSLEWAGLHPCL